MTIRAIGFFFREIRIYNEKYKHAREEKTGCGGEVHQPPPCAIRLAQALQMLKRRGDPFCAAVFGTVCCSWDVPYVCVFCV